MKVAVITRHSITNYGSLLQAIATQKVIENLGHSCEIIDYIRDDETYLQQEKTLIRRKPEWNNNLIKRTVYLAIRQPESIAAGKKFEKAQRQYLNLSKRYTTMEQLVRDKPTADVFMTGSDQVWGPVGNGSYDSCYCLSFTKDTDKRIAYGASFGHTDMTPELAVYYQKWLSRFKHIAVREDSAVEILRKMGISASHVLDPTLLLDATFWNKYTKPIGQRKYILVYQLHNDKRVGQYAKKISKSMELPLIRISSSFHQISKPGRFICLPEIGKFLSYIKSAEFMITDSFHGTAFAINFNTPFAEVLPNDNTKTRNMSILAMTGLSDRILINDDISLVNKSINYKEVNRILEEKRMESLQVLKHMIED